MNLLKQSGFLFSIFKAKSQTSFEKLFEIFKELITYTSGDFDEAIDWLKELDKEYILTSEDYTMDDFVQDLLNKGYINKQIDPKGNKEDVTLTAKTEMLLRQHALKQISPFFNNTIINYRHISPTSLTKTILIFCN